MTGEVQGVGFRDHVRRAAIDLQLVGWVRNLPDGSVECVAEGPRGALQSLLNRLRAGTRLASVREVRVDWSSAAGTQGGFEVQF